MRMKTAIGLAITILLNVACEKKPDESNNDLPSTNLTCSNANLIGTAYGEVLDSLADCFPYSEASSSSHSAGSFNNEKTVCTLNNYSLEVSPALTSTGGFQLESPEVVTVSNNGSTCFEATMTETGYTITNGTSTLWQLHFQDGKGTITTSAEQFTYTTSDLSSCTDSLPTTGIGATGDAGSSPLTSVYYEPALGKFGEEGFKAVSFRCNF